MSIKHALYRARFNLAPYVPRSFPVHLDLELAGKCPLRCTHCNFGIGDFTASMQGMMPRAMAFEALRQAAEGGALSLKPNFRGEPGLCKWLPDVVREAKRLGFVDVRMNTALTAFAPSRLDDLLDSGIDLIIVSIDGATKETYEAIRLGGDFGKLHSLMSHMRGRWDEALRKLEPFPAVHVQFVAQDANRHELAMMRTVWGELCDKILIQDVQDRGQGEGHGLAERRRCPQPWQRLIVAWDGTIFPCCSNWHNEWPLGNIRDMTLKEAWEGERMRAIRELAAAPNSGDPCRSCTVRASYK